MPLSFRRRRRGPRPARVLLVLAASLTMVGVALRIVDRSVWVGLVRSANRAAPSQPPTPVPAVVAEPTRPAWPWADCYGPPRSVAPVTSKHATAWSLFQNCRIVSFYGAPGGGAMGVLGSAAPEAVAERLAAQARVYTEAQPERPAVPAFHLVATVAQGAPQHDGSSLLRLPKDEVRRWLDLAAARDFLLFLDLHLGHSTVESELDRLAPFLAHPRVHVALDPEFAMPPGVQPGTAVGSLSAEPINRAQARLQAAVEAGELPNKILVVHQFLPQMLPDASAIADYPNVDVVIDADGYGPSETKAAGYHQFVRLGGAEFAGIKLYYQHDPDLMSPEVVLKLAPRPDVVIYQ